jgi:hypothetical protein
MDKQIYGICGFKGHGKDTLARLVVNKNPDFKVVHFADALKNICQKVFCLSDYLVYDPIGKEAPFGCIRMDDSLQAMREQTGLDLQPANAWAYSGREVLQFFGTEYVRKVAPNYWVDRLVADIKDFSQVLIPDCRFPNEAEAIRAMGGKIIRVHRTDLPYSGDSHASERGILDIKADIELLTTTGDFGPQNELAESIVNGFKEKI